MFKQSVWMESKQKDFILNKYFKDSSIVIDWKHEGQRIDEHSLVLGGRAGYEVCLTNLIHEMGHLVEIDDARIMEYSWGLTLPEVYLPGRYSRMAPTPATTQACLRECRVIAMQWLLQNAIGITTSALEAVSSLQYMPDFFLAPGVSDQDKLDFLKEQMLEYAANKYTLEYFDTEWIRKVQLIKSL
jgi:hypothetical protein